VKKIEVKIIIGHNGNNLFFIFLHLTFDLYFKIEKFLFG